MIGIVLTTRGVRIGRTNNTLTLLPLPGKGEEMLWVLHSELWEAQSLPRVAVTHGSPFVLGVHARLV